MKTKVLKAFASVQFKVLAYTMEMYKCNTLDQLASKFCKFYIAEDVHRIASDLEYAYETRNNI